MSLNPRVEIVSVILDMYEPGLLTIPAKWLKRLGNGEFPKEATIILTTEEFILQPTSMPIPKTNAIVRTVRIVPCTGRLYVPQARNLGLIGSRWFCTIDDNRITGHRQ